MRPELSEPARAVLRSLVTAHNRQPRGRFTIARAISRRGTFRISHPECNISVFPDVIGELLEQRLLEVASVQAGYNVLVITLRGFDYDAYMERPQV